jgi:transcriptional regulator with XRE-family HTH domain
VTDRQASLLGEFIRRQRERSEVSMRQFADIVGISNPYLSQIERGLRAPSEQVVQAIADALHTSADALYEGAGIKPGADGDSKVIAAVREDPDLTPRQRRALIEIYRSFTT